MPKCTLGKRRKQRPKPRKSLQPTARCSGTSLQAVDWDKLLALEKARRGVPHHQLVFVGTANVARYWWCAEQAVLKSRREEVGFFESYLSDRLNYSMKLGRIKKWPDDFKDWLIIGDDITTSDIETLLNQRSVGRGGPAAITQDGVTYINPFLPKWQQKMFKEIAEDEGEQLGDLEDEPMIAGELYESLQESHRTIRWHWQWERYVVVGVPDGIAKQFVYEFKTTRNEFFEEWFIKPVAMTQANLYGYFWNRPLKRVQILRRDDRSVSTFEEPVDRNQALDTLRQFSRIDGGLLPRPPKPWKCKRCEHKKRCRLLSGNSAM